MMEVTHVCVCLKRWAPAQAQTRPAAQPVRNKNSQRISMQGCRVKHSEAYMQQSGDGQRTP
jgi:hypothetical protein